MKREEIPRASMFTLLRAFVKDSKKLALLEKDYVMEEAAPRVKSMSLWLVILMAGLGLLTIGAVLMLVTVILVLNTWFLPWASTLIVTLAFFGLGFLLVLIGLIKTKINWDGAKTFIETMGKDILWLRRK